MSRTSPPVLDARYDDLATRTEKLAEAFTRTTGEGNTTVAGWVPPPEGEMDAGRALIRVFERMARHATERINRIPERSLLAFLNRVGVEAPEARAARVPLTFSLVAKGEAEPIVPARTRVAAKAAPGDTREVVFETERDLCTTRSKVAAVIVRQPDGDRLADRSALGTGNDEGIFDAFDAPPSAIAEHTMYLAADEVLGLPAGTTVSVSFKLAPAELATWQGLIGKPGVAVPAVAKDKLYTTNPPLLPLVVWSYHDGTSWAPLAINASPADAASLFSFEIPAAMKATSVNGRSARWIRGTLRGWPLAPMPKLPGMELSATLVVPFTPVVALSGGRAVDLSVDFFPLGDRPKLNDMFHVALDPSVARAGAALGVTVTISANAAKLTAEDAPKIAWEMSTQGPNSWSRVLANDTTPTVTNAQINNDAIRSVASIPVPQSVAQVQIGRTKAVWLRLRLTGGWYGQGVVVDYSNPAAPKTTDKGVRPPILTGISVTSTFTVRSTAPVCFTFDDLAFTERTGKANVPAFSRSGDAHPCLYVGFDRVLAPRDTFVHFQVAPLDAASAAKETTAAASAAVVWEYAKEGVWSPLACEDETRGLTTSGQLRFVAPRDLAKRSLFGRSLVWIRVRRPNPAAPASPPPSPRIGRVLTNTVWGRDAAGITGEIAGSGDGHAGQSVTLSSRPVLEGQRLEVREAAMPSVAERSAIEEAEGADAISGEADALFPGEVWVRWHQVPDFYTSGPRDRHYTLDRASGVVRFGDGRRGMPPPRGQRNVRATYLTGGGTAGNRAAHTVTELKTTVPYVDSVDNHEAAMGGADREPLDQVKQWGPRVLRHGHRAVTGEDYEDLALEASPAVARARVITARFDAVALADTPFAPTDTAGGAPVPGNVILLIATGGTELPPAPSAGLLRDVEKYVRDRSIATAALRAAGPTWIEVWVEQLTVVASSDSGLEALRDRVERAIMAFFHPITGGNGGEGWDFGQLPYESDVYRLVMSLPGVDRIRALTLNMQVKSEPPAAIGRPAVDDPGLSRMLIYPGKQKLVVVGPGGT